MSPHPARVKAGHVERVRIRKQNETGIIPVSPLYRIDSYLPRKNEIIAPRIPTKASPRMTKPIGIPDLDPAVDSKLRVAKGAGGVKVGRRVGVVWT